MKDRLPLLGPELYLEAAHQTVKTDFGGRTEHPYLQTLVSLPIVQASRLEKSEKHC